MTDTPLTDGIFSKLSEDELLLINVVYNDKLKQIEKLQSELDYQKQVEMEYNEKHTRLMSKYQESIEEIERLNNIINEFDKFLFGELQTYGGGGFVQEYYDKLQELKGSDSNE